MKRLFGSLRFKSFILVTLIALTVQAGLSAYETTASQCQLCVYPTGGICVGCVDTDPDQWGIWPCVPNQETCQCGPPMLECKEGLDG